ncbi:alpha/beta fold hydrolase [Paraburkholderia terricola]|uniref:Pimeloyl-ACP methyl ester carboxylesterase n=1 Tax=Paraburkholderia terricola TaxID=169427 RepID=A0A1M6PLL7_9BURK|nr:MULTISPECIES: alpha/beta hydrolase [Paraburkholderia]SDO46887.1 Pimeloyl-ACP methyl ester carboxylesterase [Paraburkholderia sediminicola]SHK08821.1 Pimeloyl-ACP methyl ester carboxylesterase [Paraburkholderia terricola]
MQLQASVLAACMAAVAAAGAAWLAVRWRQLKHTPALTETSRRAGIDGGYVQAGAFRMFYRFHRGPPDAANHAPVVLVHGLVISSRYMEPLAGVLGRRFRVFAPDLPGFGESARVLSARRRALSIVELADALHAWMHACGIERAMFIGNSFGCQILAEFAIRFPEAVERLVMQGPTTDPRARTLPIQVWRDLRNGRREQPRSPAPIGRIDYAKAGLPRAIATMRILIRDRIEERLPRVAAPTLVVTGTRDPVAPCAWAARAARLLPHGTLLIVDGGTHTLNYVYPHAFALLIAPFLCGDARPVARDLENAR